MSQDNLVKLKSEVTDENGKKLVHIRWSRKNKKKLKDVKLKLKKFNPLVRKVTEYTETKK